MTTQAYVFADTAGVEEMLARLDTALSAEALAEFLTVKIAPFLGARAKERFHSEGDDASGKWAPLMPATQSIRAFGAQTYGWAIGPDHPINRRTGQLEDYITSGNGKTIPWASGASLVYPDPANAQGELKDKLTTAQKGRVSPKTVPRKVLAVNETDLDYVLRRLSEHIVVGVGGRL